jgi:predicted GIY-YIG superfamily endonuclease
MQQPSLSERAAELLKGLPRRQPLVYFLRQKSGMLYIGASTDLVQRMEAHGSGQACRTTASDPPTALLGIEVFPTFAAARAREAQLKRWSRAKKEALISGQFAQLHRLAASREKGCRSIAVRPKVRGEA